MMARRFLRHCAIPLCLSVVFVTTSVQAGRAARSPGIYIPPLKTSQADELTATRWVASGTGGHMQVSAPADEAWAALEQALAGFGIKPLERDVAAREWLTDWVVWKYDSKTGTGQSKPGFSIVGKSLERHRFRFAVKSVDAADTAIITVTDHTRQEEVDIAPDSIYSWLEWQARETQQGAADTFLRRLQIAFESALATRFVVEEELTTDADGGTVIIESAAEADADVVLITIPQGEEQPVQVVEPAVIPDQPPVAETVMAPPAESAAILQAPVPVIQAQDSAATPKEPAPVMQAPDTAATPKEPDPVMQATDTAATPKEPAPVMQATDTVATPKEPAPVMQATDTAATPKEPAPVMQVPDTAATPKEPEPVMQATDTVAKSKEPVPVIQAPDTAASTEPATTKAASETPAPAMAPAPPATESPSTTVAAVKPATAVRPAANGLLVKAAPTVAWQALQRSLQDLEIGRASGDDRQYLLTTDWIEADYNRKNQVLVMRSKDQPLWAFNLWGNRGIERHRFQLVLVPANQGTRSIIYAYHTGGQEQVDQTPDSSQTLLSWEDRETSPEVALAFLRKLRIIIPQ